MTYSVLGIEAQTGQRVEISQSARRQGLYIIGSTGQGKTGLIENLIVQDIKQGLGVGLLDPHGDLTNTILARLPDTRVVDGVRRAIEEDVILLDIADYHYFFGLNLFTCSDPTDLGSVSRAANKVMHVFKKLWGKGGILVEDAWGVLLEEILRNATYTLLENPGYTMAEIPYLLEDDKFRNALVARLSYRHVKNYWFNKYNRLSQKDQLEERRSTLNRINAFLTQPIVENVVGQTNTTVDFRRVMDERKILFVKLDNRLEDVTSLIGSMIIAEILTAAYARADLPVEKRKQFNLYADEFQRFATEDFATLLTEARKFGIGTTIAHQMRSQLDVQNRSATLNVANLVVFKISSADATELAGEFDITPQEAWEEEIEPIQHTRVEEQLIDEVEEDIMEISQNPVEYLVSARGTHGSRAVREITQKVLIPLRRGGAREMLISQLLVAVMEKRIQVRTEQLADMILPIVRDQFTYPLELPWRYHEVAFVTCLVLRTDTPSLHATFTDEIYVYAWKEHMERELEGLKKRIGKGFGPGYSSRTEFTAEMAEEKYALENEDTDHQQYVRERATKEIATLVAFVDNIVTLCEELQKEPILVPTGQKRLVPKTHTHVTYLTIPAKKILHPQRSYADMLNEVASELTNLPAYSARAKIAAEGKPSEHTIRTLEPERGLGRTALQERIANIQKQNIQDGYLRERAAVEAEIIQRQGQPPEEEPPISRRPPR